MAPSLEILVEEQSAEAALRALLPKIIPGAGFEIRVFRGKHDLLKKLPQRLAGYASWIEGADHRLVVLVDRDDDECVELRARLDRIAAQAGLTATGPNRLVLNRLAIEELEAWFLGDLGAVAAAFPRVPTSTASQTPFRDPDAIRGGTAEALERLLAKHGYHKAGLAKIAAATAIAAHMEVDHNRSRSFQVLRDGLRSLVGTGAS